MTTQAEQSQNDEVLTDEFLDSIFEKGAEITKEQMFQIDKNMSSNDRAVRRRLALMVLTKSIKELCEIGEKDLDIHAEMKEQIEAAFDDARAVLEFTEAAHIRMQITDCHVQAVISTAA